MALGENVKLIPESVVYGESLEDDLITVDYNLPIGKRAAQTPKVGDPYPGDRYLAAQTAPWGYTVLETGSLTSRKSPDQGAYITGVQYAKPKVPYDSGISGLYEVYRKFETGRMGRRYGTRVFLVADANAESAAESAIPVLMPMMPSGAWSVAPLREKTIERRWRVGIAKITCIFDTVSETSELIVLNKGILECDSSVLMRPVRIDLNGKEIGIPYKDGNVWKEWRVVKGDKSWPFPKPQPTIHALLDSSNLNAVTAIFGKFNSDACPHILGVSAGKLWFDKLWFRQRRWGSGLIYDVRMGMSVNWDGWDEETKVRLHKYISLENPLYKADSTTDTGQKKHIGFWEATGASDENVLPHAKVSFALLNSYLS